MPDIIDLPGNLSIGDRTDPQLISNARSGGVSISGIEQIISPLSQRWVWRATIPIHRKDQARSLRVVLAQLQGRFNYLRARICDQYRISRREMGAFPFKGSVPHSDGAYFSDGAGYALAGGTAYPAGNRPPGVRTLTVVPSDLPIVSGVFFSINSWLYVVENYEDGEITFSPPLREPLSTESELNFDAECLWQLSDNSTGALNLQIGRFGTVTLDLVEPLGRDV